MFHYFLQLNFATILISFFMLIFVNVNPVFQRKVIRLFSIAISSVLCLVIVDKYRILVCDTSVSDNAACGSIYYWICA